MRTPAFHTALLALLTLTASTVAAPPHRYDHVVIVIEENTDYAQVFGNRVDAPFINELADGGVNFTEGYAITHPSQPPTPGPHPTSAPRSSPPARHFAATANISRPWATATRPAWTR